MSTIYSYSPPASFQGSFTNEIVPSVSPSFLTNNRDNTYLLLDPKLKEIMLSDIGMETLVNRLKQSIVSIRDFSTYIKKRASLELDRLNDLKKLSKSTKDLVNKPDSGRLGSFATQFSKILSVNDKVSDAGHTFVASLHAMYDELAELSRKCEKERKNLKEITFRQEKNVLDSELAADKAKSQYLGFCDQMEKLKNPKNMAIKFGFKSKQDVQIQEQDIQAKITQSEGDYRQKVLTATKLKATLIDQFRPQYVKQLTDLILECDTALSHYMINYASLNETLLINQSFIVAPETHSDTPSLKEIASKIDNQTDFYTDVIKAPANTKKPLNRPETRFLEHPYMAGISPIAPAPYEVSRISRTSSPVRSSALSDYSSMRSQVDNISRSPTSQISRYTRTPSPLPMSQSIPSYGTPLDELIEVENLPDPIPVPMVVSQCVSALDRFGLDAEGLYRHRGTPTQIAALKHAFDTVPGTIDLTQPARYGISDIHAVAGALKLYFQDLPDPLLTTELHREFLAAVANATNEWDRRDRVHETVNKLPDNNYAVLRYLIFHLDRVAKHESINRMSVVNLGNMWGPLLMASGGTNNVTELALQAAVVETILYNCDHIFEME